jgi:hypothetical protein
MAETPSTPATNEADDAAAFKFVVETEGVRRDVTMTVSPRPTSASGWASVVAALNEFVAAHPERF